MTGAKWPLGAAPQCVMCPDRDNDAGWDVEAFVQHHIINMGFSGVHRPLQGLMPSEKDRRLCELADLIGFMVIPWMYGDVQGGTAPEDPLGSGPNKNHQTRVVAFYHPFNLIAIGLGYDCGEWVSDNEGNRWYKRCHNQAPHLMFGVRARLDEPRRSPYDLDKKLNGYRPGDYASFEVRSTDIYTLDDMIAAANTPVKPLADRKARPVINEERFRVGPREKDLDSAAAVARMLYWYRAQNVGCVYGIRDAEPNWRWPEQHREAIQIANGITPDPEPPTEEDDMYPLEDHRNYRIKLSEPSTHNPNGEPPEVFPWPKQNHQAEGGITLDNPHMAILAVNYMLLRDRDPWEEYTVVVSINGTEIDMVVDESNTNSTQRASIFHVLAEPIEVPAGAKMKVAGIHNNEANRPHVEAKLRCKVLS